MQVLFDGERDRQGDRSYGLRRRCIGCQVMPQLTGERVDDRQRWDVVTPEPARLLQKVNLKCAVPQLSQHASVMLQVPAAEAAAERVGKLLQRTSHVWPPMDAYPTTARSIKSSSTTQAKRVAITAGC
jgi:hypothetical protein